jgi:tripartite-type tricarboxylate transporter receptor subunit TctC
LNDAVKSPDIVEKYAKQGVEADPMSPQAFGQLINDEIAKWGDIVKKAGVKVD